MIFVEKFVLDVYELLYKMVETMTKYTAKNKDYKDFGDLTECLEQ